MRPRQITARTAWMAWAVLLGGAAATVALMFVPPLIQGTRLEWLAPHLMAGWAPFCHQEAARSFQMGGTQLLACSRCTAIFAGALSGVAVAPILGLVQKVRFLPRWVLLAGAAPMALDAGLGILGLWDPTMITRTVTGALAGLSAALLLVPASILVAAELTQTIATTRSNRTHEKKVEVNSCHQE